MRTSRRKGRPLAALLFVAIAAGPAIAQVTTGTVVGTVKDVQGGVLPGATVILISETRGTKMVPVATNEQGNFVLPNVSPDRYQIEISMTGFKTLSRAGLSVGPGDRIALPALTLEPGGATETVNVVDTVPLIQAQSGERSFTISQDQVLNLPVNNRVNNQGFIALATFAPGVDGTSRLGGGGQNNAMMDGVSTMDTGNNQPILFLNTEAIAEVKVLTSGYQAEYGRSSGLQITAVTKSGTNRFHGSVYDVMRNSDWNTNSWANQKNGNPKATNKESDWGYTIGGPVGKPGGDNKLFFFYSQEWRPRETGGDTRFFRFPTAEERNGDFSNTLDQNGVPFPYIRDASLNATCSATNQAGCFRHQGVLGRIDPARLYGTGLSLLRQYPMPTMTRAEQMARGVGYNYEQLDPVVNILNTQPAVRLDYQPMQTLRTTFKYAGEMQRQQQFPGTLPGYNDTMVPHPVITTLSGTVNYTLNPTTFVEATYGITQNEVAGCTTLNGICRNAVHMNEAANKNLVGLSNLPVIFPDGLSVDPRYHNYKVLENMQPAFWEDGKIYLQPEYSWGNRVSSGPPSFRYPNWNNINRTQDVSISITKVQGRHTWKGGFYNQHSYKAENRGQGAQASGSINFGQATTNPLDSQFGFSNAALGVFQSMSQQANFMEGSYVYNNTEAYIQDNWKYNTRLTLDYGLRFVRQQPQHDALHQSSNMLPETWLNSQAPLLYEPACVNNVYPCSTANQRAKNPVTGEVLPRLALGQIVDGTGNPANGMHLACETISCEAYTWPGLALAPRVGAAYDLTGNQSFVVRGGWGIFYDRPQGTTIYSLVTNPPVTKFVTLSNGDLRTLSGLRLSGAPNLSIYQYDAPLPSSQQWNAGVQFALPWQSAVDVSYVGQHGYNLLQNVNINQVEPGAAWLSENQDRSQTPTTLGSNAVPDNMMRPFQGYGNINMQWGRGWNTYHSVQWSFNRRFVNGISFGLNHTIGLSNKGNANSGARLQYAPAGDTINYSFRPDQATADDLLEDLALQRHTLKGNFVWDLPDLNTSGGVMKAVALLANDWQLSGVASYQSGGNYSIGYSYSNGGSNHNITGSPNYSGRVLITGDPGAGCSSNQYQQFNTSVFQGPPVGSVGLESGQNYLSGCWERFWDFALMRNIRLGGSRNVQVRVEAFNAFNTVVYNGRSTNMQLASPTNQTINNPQYDASGNLIPTRLTPNNAGFGAVTGASAMRSVQAQVRFQF
jgi:hypothetical protein